MNIKVLKKIETTFIYDNEEYERIETLFISPKDGTEKISLYWGMASFDGYQYLMKDNMQELLEREYQKYIRKQKLKRITNEEND